MKHLNTNKQTHTHTQSRTHKISSLIIHNKIKKRDEIILKILTTLHARYL